MEDRAWPRSGMRRQVHGGELLRQVAGGYVLVIDDDAAIREVVAAVLESEGYAVRAASDGRAGLSLAAAERPALVLLDVRMPGGMGGWDVAAELRRLEPPIPPLVMMTAAGDAADWAAEMRADGFLPKPFELEELVRIVHGLIGPPRP